MVGEALLSTIELEMKLSDRLEEIVVAPLDAANVAFVAQYQTVSRVNRIVDRDQTLERTPAQDDPTCVADVDVPGLRLLIEPE